MTQALKKETMIQNHASSRFFLTGKELKLDSNDIIVSKTDMAGRIQYANDLFLSISGYTEDEVLNQPHSLIRHPQMPRCVFKLLWDAIKSGNEIFAYVNNRCKNGDNYWVLACVTPVYSPTGECLGYHSMRRAPSPKALEKIIPLYKTLRELEDSRGGSAGLAVSLEYLKELLREKRISYDQFIFSLDDNR